MAASAKHPTDLEWRNATVNFVITARFAKGDTSTQQNIKLITPN